MNERVDAETTGDCSKIKRNSRQACFASSHGASVAALVQPGYVKMVQLVPHPADCQLDLEAIKSLSVLNVQDIRCLGSVVRMYM